MIESLTADDLRVLGSGAVRSLERHRRQIDAMNVFPVPDGDTGGNMLGTLRAACGPEGANEQPGTGTEASAGALLQKASMGALMGARGNSGLILAQMLRGIARAARGSDVVSASTFAEGLVQASELSYRAVAEPKEGTILTVAKAAAASGRDAAARGEDVLGVLNAARRAAREALARTPDLLPVLKEAGVVDAAGLALCHMLDGATQFLRHRRLALKVGRELARRAATRQALAPEAPAHLEGESDFDLRFPIEVQLVLTGPGLDLERLRAELLPMGDSLVVAGDEFQAKVHIHTDRPDETLAILRRFGQTDHVEVTDMRPQAEAFRRNPAGQA
ncbi:MAG: DAK2 domain-containing protein [Clostridia bacterium]|nr:DAK2 domain-containing protein [Clostridia bacterium]